MRILFLTEKFPYPLKDGGNLRTYHVLEGLARRHEVWLLSHEPSDSSGYSELQKTSCHIRTAPNTSHTVRMLKNSVYRVTSRLPLFISRNWSDGLLRTADRLLSEHTFDAIHFNHLDTACFALERNWRQWQVFDTHNCLSVMAGEIAADALSSVRRHLFRNESRKLRVVEREVAERMDLTLVCSEVDGERFREIGPQGEYLVIPNGVNVDLLQSCPNIVREPGNLVFTGAMDYYPNEDAVDYFCQEIMPLLSEVKPLVRMHIVGRDPTARVRALAQGEKVIVTGAVEDIREYLAKAEICVVPLRHGSGTRLKILEALAAGTPVVSTHKGAEGIPLVDGEHILLADDPSTFATAVSRLLESPQLRQRLSQAGLDFVRRNFDWSRIQDQVCQAYDGLAGHRATRRECGTAAARRLTVFADDWRRHPSSCQHLVQQLLDDCTVSWVNSIGTRQPGFNAVTAQRFLEKLSQWKYFPSHSRTSTENPRVLNPIMWPSFGSDWGRRINQRLLTRLFPAGDDRSTQSVALTTIPIVADLVGTVPVDRWVYYCVDDFSTWPGLDSKTLLEMERLLIKKADACVAAGENLANRLREQGVDPVVITHGVDLEHWRLNGKAIAPPAAIADLPKPLVLFWGLIDPRLDIDLLTAVSRDLTEGTVVLIGPQQSADPGLDKIPRLVKVGALPFEQLPAVAAHAQVLIMPYADLPVTQAMQPLKLKEYLATGKPVVARRLGAVEPWADCLDAVENPADFAAAVLARLDGALPTSQETSRCRLEHESWQAKAEALRKVLFSE